MTQSREQLQEQVDKNMRAAYKRLKDGQEATAQLEQAENIAASYVGINLRPETLERYEQKNANVKK